jgi:hypothetical protein
MREMGALENCGGSTEAETKRARAMLQLFHQFGVVVYFDEVPGLMNHAILGPQWVIDNITYVVRDFKLHRFRRDVQAMLVDGGKAWDNLVARGMLTTPLLQSLWVGEREHHRFLVGLMCKLGLFAPLPTRTADGQARYLVPCTVSASAIGTSESEGGLAIAKQHPALKDTDDIDFGLGKVVFLQFLPTGFFERLVAKLVSDWSKAYEEHDPLITHNAAYLKLGPFPLTLVLDKTQQHILAFVELVNAGKVLPHVRQALDEVDKEVYSGCIKFKVEGMNESGGMVRSAGADVCSTHADSGLMDEEVGGQDSSHSSKLADFFTNSCKFKREKAQEYAINIEKTLEGAIHSADSLVDMYETDRKRGTTTLREVLQSCGIKASIVRFIEAALSNMPPPSAPQSYLLGFYGGDELVHVNGEIMKIEEILQQARLNVLKRSMRTVSVEAIVGSDANDKFVLHLAMHGQKKSPGGKHTLDFKTASGSVPEPETLAQSIGSVCQHDDDRHEQGGQIECVFINACCGSDIADLLKNKYNVPWVVAWTTVVDDEAAHTFAEAFYTALTARGKKRNYQNAYDRAKSALELRQWVVDEDGGNPGSETSKKALRERQKRKNNPLLKAAGILRLYSPSAEWLERARAAMQSESQDEFKELLTLTREVKQGQEVGFREVRHDLGEISVGNAKILALLMGWINETQKFPHYFYIVPVPVPGKKTTSCWKFLTEPDSFFNSKMQVVFICARSMRRIRYGDKDGLEFKVPKPKTAKRMGKLKSFWGKYGAVLKVSAAILTTAVKAAGVDLKALVPDNVSNMILDVTTAAEFVQQYANTVGELVDDAYPDHPTISLIKPAEGAESINTADQKLKGVYGAAYKAFSKFLEEHKFDAESLDMKIDQLEDEMSLQWVCRNCEMGCKKGMTSPSGSIPAPYLSAQVLPATIAQTGEKRGRVQQQQHHHHQHHQHQHHHQHHHQQQQQQQQQSEPEDVPIGDWLMAIHATLGQYTAAFVDYGFDYAGVLQVQDRKDLDEAMQDMKVKKGHQKLIVKAFERS